MDDLKKEAEALGIDVDGRWSEETLREKIAEAKKSEQAKTPPPQREKTLHELNVEARRYDRALRGLNDEAAEAAKKAVSDTLNEKRPGGRRTRKNLRPVAD